MAAKLLPPTDAIRTKGAVGVPETDEHEVQSEPTARRRDRGLELSAYAAGASARLARMAAIAFRRSESGTRVASSRQVERLIGLGSTTMCS